jgi:hypothetical protein
MATLTRSRSGRFVSARRRSSVARRSSPAVVVVGGGTRRGSRRGRSRRRGAGGMSLGKLLVAGVALGYVGRAGGMAAGIASKVPGNKTFGGPAALGIACFAIDKWVKPNPWLRAAGVIGIAAAALKVGEQNTAFQWVGDDDVGIDLAGDADLMDVDDLDDGDDDE